MTIRFALLGAGRIGKVHGAAIAAVEGARLVALADPDAAAAAALAAKYGADIREVEAIAASDDIDAVVVASPTDRHAEQIELFARAGKAIFCEKPIDLSLERVRACLAVVEETKTPFMLGFNRRFDASFMALKAQIQAGRIGTPEMATLTSRDPAPPPIAYIRVSGGIFRDMTIHDFDMARFLMGEEIAQVTARAAVMVDPAIGEAGDFDSASVVLETVSGRQVIVSNSRRASYGYDQRIEVHGSKGMIAAENQRPAMIEVADEGGFTRPPLYDFFMTRYTQAYANEIAAFVAALTDGAPITSTGADGVAALRIAEAALLSVREGRTVALSEIP
ncbi:inositol 2-dehydrogenase [Salinarimonas ramus]|uniref:Inositol 2-dehydrogenase n=1 Tax=Salinarimonas ramus TaxID=690164 RepID=A0A917Q3W0_9HYPH|nr:inositol 2-dehydrogenase [Salinarimonas ramus]GGK20073.1 inositol 2-dehydrogenase [Salinarimonas ramus]